MKTSSFALLALVFLFSQCKSNQDVATPTPKIDYDLASTQLMANLAPKIVGQWTLRSVKIKYQSYNVFQKEANILKDTTFVNLATLTIVPAVVPRTSPIDPRRGEYDGTIQYGNKTYPISFDMLANPDWIYNKKGFQTFFLFGYHFPNGSHMTEKEETQLQNIGLIGDNYSLEINSENPKQMIWRGYNRGVDQIELVKIN